MNFKRHAQKLETFLNDEFAKNLPVVQLPNGTVVYNHFKVKKNKANVWALQKTNLASPIDVFNLKVCALLAAKFYDVSRFDRYNEVKNLDTGYWNNSLDSVRFRQRYTESKDISKKELYASRWIVTNIRAEKYKEQISVLFRNTF